MDLDLPSVGTLGEEPKGKPSGLNDELRRSTAWVHDANALGSEKSLSHDSFSASASEHAYGNDDSSTVSHLQKKPAKRVPAKKPAGRMGTWADGKGSGTGTGKGNGSQRKKHAKGSSCGKSTGATTSSASKPVKSRKAKMAKK